MCSENCFIGHCGIFVELMALLVQYSEGHHHVGCPSGKVALHGVLCNHQAHSHFAGAVIGANALHARVLSVAAAAV
jgi:hypothetical protein